MGEAGSARNSTRPRGTATAPRTFPDAATSVGSRTSRNSTSVRPSNPLASSGLILGTAASASASMAWTVFISFSPLLHWVQHDHGNLAAACLALVVGIGRPETDPLLPQLRPLRAGGGPCPHLHLLGSDLKLDVRMGQDVAVPARVLRRTALRSDHEVAVARTPVEQREQVLVARLAPGRGQQEGRNGLRRH